MNLAQIEVPWYASGNWLASVGVILLLVLFLIGNWRRRRK